MQKRVLIKQNTPWKEAVGRTGELRVRPSDWPMLYGVKLNAVYT